MIEVLTDQLVQKEEFLVDNGPCLKTESIIEVLKDTLLQLQVIEEAFV